MSHCVRDAVSFPDSIAPMNERNSDTVSTKEAFQIALLTFRDAWPNPPKRNAS